MFVVRSPENPRKQPPTMESESRGPQGSPRDGRHGWAWAHPLVTAASHLRTTVASGEDVGGARGPPHPPGSSLQLSCAAFCPCHRTDEKEIRLWLEKVKQMR